MTQWQNQPYSPMVIAAIIAFILMLLALGIAIANAVTPRTNVEKCVDHEPREKIQRLMTEGIDEALKAHTKKMYDIWVQDETDQPKRAIEGMRSGIRAYIRARAAALRWDPPTCKEVKP